MPTSLAAPPFLLVNRPGLQAGRGLPACAAIPTGQVPAGQLLQAPPMHQPMHPHMAQPMGPPMAPPLPIAPPAGLPAPMIMPFPPYAAVSHPASVD